MILVTGGTGQLATSLASLSARVRRVGRPEFDFDAPETIDALFEAGRPDAVINAAAWTAVDLAESHRDAAWRANCDGPARLARRCAERDIPFIHVSTDYVFDGNKGAPYVETDPPAPTGVYGASKLAGEKAVLEACPQAVILRTSWVFAATGRNFLRTMLDAGSRNPTLRVVSDQIGCPTAAPALARVILEVQARMAGAPGGIVHAAGEGWTSWHGFAEAIFASAARYGVAAPTVQAIRTEDWPTPTRRPPDSRLDCGLLAARFGLRLPHWRQSLDEVIDQVFSREDRPR